MSSAAYALLGYVVSAVVLGGYAINLWIVHRRLQRREHARRLERPEHPS